MNRPPKKKKRTEETGENSPNANDKDSTAKRLMNPLENSTVYRKNKKTGEWEVINPSGSVAYNYLTRDDYWDD